MAAERVREGGEPAARPGEEAGHRNFFAPPPWPPAGGEVALSAEESRHAHRAARVPAGVVIRLVDGEGREASAQVVRAGRAALVARLLEVREVEREDARAWTLALPRLRAPARMDWVIEKATELGCRAVLAYAAGRSLKGGRATREGRTERWRALALAAMKQSGRAWCPRIDEHASLAAALDAWAAGARRGRLLFGDERGLAFDAVPAFERGRALLIAVGPEGGFTPEERAELARRGGEGVLLAPYRLRSESAAVCLAALVAARLAGGADGR